MADMKAILNEMSKAVDQLQHKYSKSGKSTEPNVANNNQEGRETSATKTDAIDTEDEPYITIAKLLKHVTPKDVPFVVDVIVNGMAAINAAKNLDEKEAVGAGSSTSLSAEENTPLGQPMKGKQENTQ